jgi:hypothetical protein
MMRRIFASLITGVFVMGALAAMPASAAPTLPPQAHPRGHSYQTWLQMVGQWFLGDASNPLFAGLEGDCGQMIDGVFFMVAPIALDQEFQCDVPTGTPIVLSHAGWFSTEGVDGDTDAELQQAADAGFVYSVNSLSVDGTTVPLHRVSTGAYDVISEPGSFYDQILGLGTGAIRTVVTGDVVFIHPLAPGRHVIEAAVTFTPVSNGDYSATYNVHVG